MTDLREQKETAGRMAARKVEEDVKLHGEQNEGYRDCAIRYASLAIQLESRLASLTEKSGAEHEFVRDIARAIIISYETIFKEANKIYRGLEVTKIPQCAEVASLTAEREVLANEVYTRGYHNSKVEDGSPECPLCIAKKLIESPAEKGK